MSIRSYERTAGHHWVDIGSIKSIIRTLAQSEQGLPTDFPLAQLDGSLPPGCLETLGVNQKDLSDSTLTVSREPRPVTIGDKKITGSSATVTINVGDRLGSRFSVEFSTTGTKSTLPGGTPETSSKLKAVRDLLETVEAHYQS